METDGKRHCPFITIPGRTLKVSEKRNGTLLREISYMEYAHPRIKEVTTKLINLQIKVLSALETKRWLKLEIGQLKGTTVTTRS